MSITFYFLKLNRFECGVYSYKANKNIYKSQSLSRMINCRCYKLHCDMFFMKNNVILRKNGLYV